MDEKKYIIVAEDDKFYANIYNTQLTQKGYEVKVVGDGSQLLTAARERKPDLILLDLIMPGKDGMTTLEEISKDEELKHIKVIVLSNLSQKEDINKVLEFGAIDHVIKSEISLDEMIEKVVDALA